MITPDQRMSFSLLIDYTEYIRTIKQGEIA